MEYRRLGNGPLMVSEISLGNWLTAGAAVEEATATRCVHAALDLGITLFDTANMYGAGAAERVLGAALRSSGRSRDQYLIATKVFNPVGDGTGQGLSAAQIALQLDRSLERLGVEYVDLYQCHRYDKETPLEETLEALDGAVRSGKVRSIGLSEWPAEKIHEAAGLTGERGWQPMTSSQPQYSLLWRKPEGNGVFAACREHGLGNIVYGPLAQGILTGKYVPGAPAPAGTRAADAQSNFAMTTLGRRFTSDEVWTAVDGLKPIAEELGLTMPQLALAWVLRRAEVSSAIIGASRPEQVVANVAASGVRLPDAALARMDAALADVVLW